MSYSEFAVAETPHQQRNGNGDGNKGRSDAKNGSHEDDGMANGVIEAVAGGVERAEAYWGEPNLGASDRIASGLAGAALTLYSLRLSGPSRTALATTGGYMLLRGATGHCIAYHLLRTGTNRPVDGDAAVIPHGQGIKVTKSVTIMKPASELYAFWRKFDNLPHFMKHLESVTILDGDKSHWVAKAPLGRTVAWDAEIIADIPNEKIAWRSIEPADIPNAGSVEFKDRGIDRGTQVSVTLEYNPPAGILGATVAKLLGEEPHGQIQQDLMRFQALMEAGEIPTITGQPIGAGKGRVKE